MGRPILAVLTLATLAAGLPLVAAEQDGSVLFRGSLSPRYQATDRHSVSVMADHSSNGYFCDPNPGLDTVGVRYGYRF